ncbi:MAG: hypothetical protein IJP54_01120, partial [Synergistaceae bacterium]|nr:hypothetical protein [Synergistaceae bacterium]
MTTRHSVFFTPYNSVRVFTVLALLVFAVSVMSGGCGGSSSSLSQNLNDRMNGAWVYNSGTVTANVNGMRSELTVLNFAVL